MVCPRRADCVTCARDRRWILSLACPGVCLSVQCTREEPTNRVVKLRIHQFTGLQSPMINAHNVNDIASSWVKVIGGKGNKT